MIYGMVSLHRRAAAGHYAYRECYVVLAMLTLACHRERLCIGYHLILLSADRTSSYGCVVQYRAVVTGEEGEGGRLVGILDSGMRGGGGGGKVIVTV